MVEKGYSQGHNTQIEKELLNFQVEHKIPKEVSFDSIPANILEILIYNIERKIISKDVVGALYADTEGVLYGFKKNVRILRMTTFGYEFLLKYQTVVFKLVNYELANFLQRKNPLVKQGILLEEIENITRRESLVHFRNLLEIHSGTECFYTEKYLGQGVRSVAVDHFVPWSFVHSDDLWNFVLTSNSLNSSKGNKLPTERYLQKLDHRNRHFNNVGDVYVKQYMENYDFNQLVKLYEYAGINGFEKGWFPK